MSKELQEISRILSETPMCFIATMDGTQPRVRAFQFQFEQGGKLWFCTARNKDVFKQLQANPAVEICAVKQDMTWLRLTGKMALADDMAVKERVLAAQPLIKGIYGSADNPVFASLCLEHGEYVIADFSGNPPRKGMF